MVVLTYVFARPGALLLFLVALSSCDAAVSTRYVDIPDSGPNDGGPNGGGPNDADVANVVTPGHWPRASFSVIQQKGGALTLKVGLRTYLVESNYSEPGATKGKWNQLTANTCSFETCTATGNTTPMRVEATGTFYKLKREVFVKEDHVEVEDTLTSTHSGPVGIRVRHRVRLPNPAKTTEVRTGGFGKDERAQIPGLCVMNNWGNHTLYFKDDLAGLGMLPLDDVFRVQVASELSGIDGCQLQEKETKPSVVLGNIVQGIHFAIGAGKTYTMRWAIYPVPKEGDYYSFINSVRSNTAESQTTLDGNAIFIDFTGSGLVRQGYPEDWPTWKPETMRKFLQEQGIRYVLSVIPLREPPGGYAHGSAFVHEHSERSKAYLQNLIAKVHEADPSVKVLIYFHAFISTETNAASLYSNCRVLKANGEQAYYDEEAVVKKYPLFYGTTENAYGKELDAYIEKVMTEFKADGIYFDEHSRSKVFYHYGDWDGYSMQTDPVTFQCVQGAAGCLRSHLTLITLQQRLKLVKRVRDLGGTVIANMAPVTESFAKEKIIHFTESPSQRYLYLAQLHTPIALNKSSTQVEPGLDDNVAANTAAHVERASLSFTYLDPFQPTGGAVAANPATVMFPLTPIEIRSGAVMGKERMVITHSGTYGWGTGDALEVHVFDAAGRERTKWDIPASVTPTYATLELTSGEIGILVRKVD